MKIFDLRTEYRHEALGTVLSPRFFWKYRAAGAETREFTLTLWKAGEPEELRIVTKENTYVACPEKLLPLTRYFWRVECGDAAEETSFVTGVETWRARFLEKAGSFQKNEYALFRKTVRLSHPEEGLLAVASRGYHKLYVNGHALSDGFAPNRSHIEEGILLSEVYDLLPYLKEGENTFEIYLDDGWGRKCGLASAFSSVGFLKDQNGEQKIDTNTPWMCYPTGEWCTGEYAWGDFGGEHLRDKALAAEGMPAAFAEIETLSVRPDQMERDQIARRIRPIAIGDEMPWKIDMGENFSGFVRLKLKGEKGTTATLTVSDKESEEITFHQVYEYEFAGGDGVFENKLNWLSGRYLWLSGAERPDIEDIEGFVATNLPRKTGGFRGDPDLETIERLDVGSFIANTISGVTMDCPHRERLGYGETGCSTTWGLGLPLYDSAAYYAAYLRTWVTSQYPDGRFPHVSPDFWGGGGTQWSNYPVIGLADFYEYYPDDRLVADMRPALLKWLGYLWSHVKDGVMERYEHDEWDFLGDWATPDGDDWGKNPEALGFNNCSFAYALRRALNIPGLFTEEEKVLWEARHKELCRGIEKAFYHDGFYVAPHARYQGIALLSGAADGHYEATEKAMIGIVERKGYLDGGSAGFTMMLRALMRTEKGRETALKALRRRECPGYLYFADRGQTTLPEMWDIRDIYGGSRIHTCYSGASGFLMRGLAGISLNGNEATIKPHLSPLLPSFEAETGTLCGTLKVKVSEKAVCVTLPYGMKGKLMLDKEYPLEEGENCIER